MKTPATGWPAPYTTVKAARSRTISTRAPGASDWMALLVKLNSTPCVKRTFVRSSVTGVADVKQFDKLGQPVAGGRYIISLTTR